MKFRVFSLIGLVCWALLISCTAFPLLAATFTVNIAADDANAHDANPGDGVCADTFGDCTLRAAIEEANASDGPDVILFADGLAGQTLTVSASEGQLPVISTPIFLLGNSIASYNSTATLLRNAPPQFTIDGSQLSSGSGLTFATTAASGGLVYALSIVNFPSSGIVLAFDANNISIDRNYIGVRPNGDSAGNGGNGIEAAATNNHQIGKLRDSGGVDFIGLGNVISSNNGSGINLSNSDDNTVNANLIGISPSGTGDMGNGSFGVRASGTNNQIGDHINADLAGNFLAGNDLGGIRVIGDSNRLYSNQLGQGETDGFINSEGDGIRVEGELNYIGINNIFSGNKIYEHSGAGIFLENANANFVYFNYIGASHIQAGLRSSNGDGIRGENANLNGFLNNVIVNSSELGALPGYVGTGIRIVGNTNSFFGNQIGYIEVANNILSQPNEGGIFVFGNDNEIGSEQNPNYVAGNSDLGIFARGQGNSVNYNNVGVTRFNGILGNDGFGIHIDHRGGSLEVKNNYITANSSTGLRLTGLVNSASIRQNVIGLTPNDLIAGNADGIHIVGGDLADIAGNVIAHNSGDGIRVTNEATGMAIFQNSIFNNAEEGIDLGGDGITVNDTGDFDEGENRLQNSPVIEEVIFNQNTTPRTLTIRYRVDSTDSINASDYPLSIDFYWNSAPGTAQGKTFIAFDIPYTSPNTQRTVNFDFNSSAAGGYLTATAIDQDRNTSEFSTYVEFGEVDLIFKDGFE